jgi:hypothetical protein
MFKVTIVAECDRRFGSRHPQFIYAKRQAVEIVEEKVIGGGSLSVGFMMRVSPKVD